MNTISEKPITDLQAPFASTVLNEISDAEILHRAKCILEAKFTRSHYLTSPDCTRDYLKMVMASEERELFVVILLDSQNGVMGSEILFQGTIDGASVYPREVVKTALVHNAAAVIFAHNHPSGIPEPSLADQLLTERLEKALATVEIRTLDHLIIGGNRIVSFAERGLLSAV